MDSEKLENMQVPLVEVLEQQTNKSKVMFVIKYVQRTAERDGKMSLVRYTGWTEADNVKPYLIK